MINIVLSILIISITGVLITTTRLKGIIAVITVFILAALSSFPAVKALMGNNYEVILSGTVIFGNVPLSIDALSGWFILLINFTFITGSLYGFNYMKKYKERKNEITMHCIAFILSHFSLLGICTVQNGFILLLLWELMALTQFILVIFEHEKPDTIKAGLNYLVQSHISIVFIMLGFIYVAYKTGHYNFADVADFSSRQSSLEGTALFLCFFTGFAVKSGFIPMHTWLPYAHPAAPTHVSGIMSGVVIKIGIYGILRMLLLIKTDYTTIGYIILIISTCTGIYGVMLATVQHNLKKLLAYHSIENIGIIGMGIGLGCIGLGTNNKWMAILGFSGAMLHTLNHSLFKSLLFYSVGNVYQSTGTVNIEHLGGLFRRMPQTAVLFLTAAIAICGLPPLNGFISEFIIYGGLYNWVFSANLISLIIIVFAIGGLVLIGGLAILCFTKAFSIVFLGTGRKVDPAQISERGFWQIFPMYLALIFMLSIGLFPHFYLDILQRPVNLFTHNTVFNLNLLQVGAIDSLAVINWLFFGLIILVILLLLLRNYFSGKNKVETNTTWGCAYNGPSETFQYTASSFVKSYSRLAKPLLEIEKTETDVSEVFPSVKHYETEHYDKIEKNLIDKPLGFLGRLSGLFLFLQNGHLQRYILYGIIFITGVLGIPLIYEKIMTIIKFLNNL